MNAQIKQNKKLIFAPLLSIILCFLMIFAIGFSNLKWIHYIFLLFIMGYGFSLYLIPDAMRNPNIAPYFFMAPAAFFFIILVVLPIFISFALSLYESDGLGTNNYIGLGNYKELIDDDVIRISLLNNIFWLLFFLLSPVIGLSLALFLNQKIKGIKLAKSLFFFPFVISLVVVGMVFSWFYDPQNGLLMILFGWLLPDGFNILGNENLATFGIIFAGLWPQSAYCLIIYLAGLTSIDNEQVEAARMDGAKGLAMLKGIILPQLAPATFIAIVVTIIGALRSFDLIAIMTNGGPYDRSQVLSLQVFQQSITNYRAGYGSSIAVVLFLIMSVFIFFFIRHMIQQEEG